MAFLAHENVILELDLELVNKLLFGLSSSRSYSVVVATKKQAGVGLRNDKPNLLRLWRYYDESSIM